jgi:hypothetical protein
MATFLEHDGGRVATSWIIHANEYLNAVHCISIADRQPKQPALQSAPSNVLLSYAYELIFSAEIMLRNAEPRKHHDLLEYWKQSKVVLEPIVGRATQAFIKQNLDKLGNYRDAMLEAEPDYGRPKRDFINSLEQLNAWTNTPYLARYPKIGVMFDGHVDIDYLYFVGDYLQKWLKAYSIELKKKSSAG